MLIQKISKEVLWVQKDVEIKKYRDELGKAAEMFDLTLKAMIKEGQAPYDVGRNVVLPLKANYQIMQQLEKVRSSWHGFYMEVQVVLKEYPASPALNRAVAAMRPLLPLFSCKWIKRLRCMKKNRAGR